MCSSLNPEVKKTVYFQKLVSIAEGGDKPKY